MGAADGPGRPPNAGLARRLRAAEEDTTARSRRTALLHDDLRLSIDRIAGTDPALLAAARRPPTSANCDWDGRV
ncbi:hypothetical protein EASAB2608_06560 [Streptomyces sp. EAS-AB2608]|nr:hypothetical protein EASAB2608_06560 [Streptomyces sp. EAS-AB2608]